MGCRSIHKKLLQYVQGLLSAADARRIDDHVRACIACREELADLRKIWNALDGLPASDAAASMAPEVLRRIDDYEQKRTDARWAWLSLFRPSFAGAVAAIMLIGFVSGAFISAVYSADSAQEQAADDSAYSEILSDAPPASFFDLYLQTASQNGEENSL
jgi:anti-sigma factor RsiW